MHTRPLISLDRALGITLRTHIELRLSGVRLVLGGRHVVLVSPASPPHLSARPRPHPAPLRDPRLLAPARACRNYTNYYEGRIFTQALLPADSRLCWLGEALEVLSH